MTQELHEQIARKAAEAGVTVRVREGGCAVMIGNYADYSFYRQPWAEEEADAIRAALAPLFLAAIETALRCTALPTPLSDERLAEIAVMLKEHVPEGDEEEFLNRYWEGIEDLLAEVLLCRRIIGDADVTTAMLREAKAQGFREGAEAQKAACLIEARRAEDERHWDGGTHLDAVSVRVAVEDAPLATMPTTEEP